MAEASEKKGDEEQQCGTVLVCGATDWYSIGRSKEVRPEYPSLSVPHRLKALEVRLPPPPPAAATRRHPPPPACPTRARQLGESFE